MPERSRKGYRGVDGPGDEVKLRGRTPSRYGIADLPNIIESISYSI